MDPKELRGLMEAYSEVYAPQEEIEEAMTSYERNRQRAAQRAAARNVARDAGQTGAVKGVGYVTPRREKETWTDEGGKERHKTGARMPQKEEVEQIDEISAGLAGKVVNARIERTGAAADRENRARTPQNVRDTVAAADKEARARKLAAGVRKRRAANEEVDIFDIVLEFLQAEGYAETLEEAEWLMANELNAEDIEEILEAEGSYGQTPKARAAMGKLAIGRMRKPATEYSQKGEKTKKVKAAEKQTRRQDTLARGLSGGKKSSRPWGIRGKMTDDDREEARSKAVEYGEGGTYGSGGVTKNPKKLRKQKAMGEHD